MESNKWERKTPGWPVTWLSLTLLFLATHATELSYSVLEELKAGTFVGDITKDLGMDIRMIIQRNLCVVSDVNAKYFNVNSVSGALVIRQTMDRESICGASLTCSLRVQLLLQNPLEMHSVVVEIMDVNDNAPQFLTRNSSMEVSEAAAPGTRFGLESAQDTDVGINSLRSYVLSPNDCFILQVETKSNGRKSPVLLLDKPLDRERQDVFYLIITAVDGGKPEKSGTTIIVMNILDVNDNAPVFEQPGKRVRLLENSPPGTLVTQLNASDADYGLNGEISYLFDKYTPEQVLKLFTLDSMTGDIRVNGEVDRELADVYDITVQARDGGRPAMEGFCNIKVEIIDTNDNTPVISINSLSNVVNEDVESGTVITTISVRDEDAGGNGEVSVQIPPGLPFKLSSLFEGQYAVMTDGLLDRELVAEYTITVTAADSGSPARSSQESFVVRLSDVNDNSPVFSQPSYSVDMAENNAPSAPVITVSAFDPDLGENSTLSFSILEIEVHGSPVSSYVYMNADKGHVYATRALDREQTSVLQIVVQVRDAGAPVRSSNTTVHVFVTDENDHAPAVVYPTLPPDGALQLSMPRSAGLGHLVNRIVCVDGDSGHNAWLFYSLSGPDAGLFHIGAHTGELRMARRLAQDEGVAALSLTVLVQDNGTPSLSTSVALNVTLSEKGSDTSPERRSMSSRRGGGSDITLYLIVCLSCVTAVCLLTFAALVLRWLSRRGHLTCLGRSLCLRHAVHQRSRRDLHLQLNADGPVRYMEVVGESQDPHKRTYRPCYSTLASRSDFVFVKTPHNDLGVTLSKKLFTSSTNKQKPPSNDWHCPPNHRPGTSGQHRFHTMHQRWTPYEKARAGAHPEGAGGAGGGAVAGTGPWPNPPTETEQLQALMAAAHEVSEAAATLGPRYTAQYVTDYRQNVYIPGSTATLTANRQQQQALPPPQALPPADAPKAAQTPASKKKSTKKDKK